MASQRRAFLVTWVSLALAALLAWASLTTTDAIAIGPGQVVNIASRVQIADHRLPHSLALDAASISVTVLSPLRWAIVRLASGDEVLSGLRTTSLGGHAESASSEAVLAAAVAGYRSLGVTVSAVHGLVVREVVPGSPADGRLAVGDLVVAADGAAIASLSGFDATLAAHPTNPRVSLEVIPRKGGPPHRVVLPFDGGRLGIVVTTATLYRLPSPVEVDLPHALEGSAGLAEATAILLMLSRTPPPRNLSIGLVGAVSPDGRVLPTFGVALRVLALSRDHLRYVLVPEAEVPVARAAAGDRSIVVGVRTLRQVLEFLRGVHSTSVPVTVAH
jgi:PDZ domain-containing secreted protein